ncbi:MAG TPA: extracellular solute-binding protein [Cellulomonas sp.]
MRARLTAVTALAAATCIALTAACSPGGGDDSSAGDESSFSYRIPDRFKAWLDDLNWYPALEEASGVSVDLIDGGPEESHYQQLDLKLSQGDIGDATVATAAQVQTYGPQGAFLDLAPLIKEKAPHLQQYIDDNEDFRKLITEDDGAIYGLVNEYPKVSILTFYRSDVAAQAGVTAQPRTISEFTDFLRALQAASSGVPGYHALSGRDVFTNYQYAFAANDGVDEDGTVHGIYASGRGSDVLSDGYRDMVEWYHTLYSEGLIDPEWVAGTQTEEQWETKMLTGQASVTNDFFTRPYWFMTNVDTDKYPDFGLDVLPALQSDTGEQMMQPANERYNLQRVFVVNAKTEKTDAILAFLDYLYSDEGQDIYHYGVEGESYEVTDAGPQYTVRFEDEGTQPLGTKVWNFQQDRLTFPAPVSDQAYYDWQDEFTRSFAQDYFDSYLVSNPVLKYTTEQASDRAALVASVEPFVLGEVTKFVTGQRDLSEWDAFIADVEDAGYRDITAIDQDAYDAMQ